MAMKRRELIDKLVNQFIEIYEKESITEDDKTHLEFIRRSLMTLGITENQFMCLVENRA